jgi:hypothetical protein
MTWKCDCDYARILRGDGIVASCPACGATEYDALREAIPVPDEPDFIEGYIEV